MHVFHQNTEWWQEPEHEQEDRCTIDSQICRPMIDSNQQEKSICESPEMGESLFSSSQTESDLQSNTESQYYQSSTVYEYGLHPVFQCYTKSQIKKENPIAFPFLKEVNKFVMTCDSQEAGTKFLSPTQLVNFLDCNPKAVNFRDRECIQLQNCYCDIICHNKDQVSKLIDATRNICHFLYVGINDDSSYSEIFNISKRIPLTITIWDSKPTEELFSIEGTNTWRDHTFWDHVPACDFDDFDDECYILTLISREYGQVPKNFNIPSVSEEGYPIRITKHDNLNELFWTQILECLEIEYQKR